MSAKESPSPAVTRVQPTVFFTSSPRGLLQAVDVEVHTPGEPRRLGLSVSAGTRKVEVDLGRVASGATSHRIRLPDIREEVDVELRLLAQGSVVHSARVRWRPQRHWTVHLCQLAHFDPGYTDLPSNVMREYLEFLDEVVACCERTRRWPPEARFHYTVEQAWVAVHYVEHRPPKAVARFVHFCRAGQIEVNACYANMTSELLGPEQVARLLYPAFSLKRRYGIPIRTAEHNDVPGMSWALATVLADAGIELFLPGIPDYFRWVRRLRRNFADHLILPNDRPAVFSWEAQNGRKVLTWLQHLTTDADPSLSQLPSVLRRLEEAGYPYRCLRYVLTGGTRDNAPPRFDFAATVRDWNSAWAYPRLRLSTNHEFSSDLAGEIGGGVPVHRGDYPGTDYPVGATSTADDVGVNRAAKGLLVVGERLATIAAETSGFAYPRRAIEEAYRATLQHDEHAWGLSRPAGWGAEAHRREKALYAHRAAALAEDVLLKSANRIADQIDLRDDGTSIVVFNPLEHPRTDFVTVPSYAARPCGMPMHLAPPGDPRTSLWQPGTAVGRELHGLPEGLFESAFDLVDLQTGAIEPHQAIRLSGPRDAARFAPELATMATYAPEYRSSLGFVARDVPAFGYRTFRIVPRPADRPASEAIAPPGNVIENEFYRITASADAAAIASIYDKELGRELVDARASPAAGQLFSRHASSGERDTAVATAVHVGAAGPLQWSLVIEGTMPGVPQITLEVLLCRGLKRIDFRLRLLKDGDGTRTCFVAFPFRFARPRFAFEGPANMIRPIEDQLPGTTTDCYAVGSVVSITEEDGSLGIAWSAPEAPMVQLGDTWPDYVSPAHHGAVPYRFEHEFLRDPRGFGTGHLYCYLATNNFRTNFAASQPGPLFCTYAITSGRPRSTAEAREFGRQCCHPLPHAIVKGPQTGSLPPTHSFCSLDARGVMVTTIKRAEDGDDLIVRLLETEGVAREVTVSVPFFPFAEAILTNLVEENLRLLGPGGTSFRLPVEAWSFATVRLVRRRTR